MRRLAYGTKQTLDPWIWRYDMRNEFTAVAEEADGWWIAYSPEMPGANGQGRTKDEAFASLKEAISLILDDRREDGLRGVPEGAVREIVTLE